VTSYSFCCDCCARNVTDDKPRLHCTTCSLSPKRGPCYDLCWDCWLLYKDSHEGHLYRVAEPSVTWLPQEERWTRLALSIWSVLNSLDGLCMKDHNGSWLEYFDVSLLARSLQTYLITHCKISQGSMVLILLDNCPEWLISDFACIFAGLVTVPVGTSQLIFF